jgi:HSP20 family molecular chaperone IbpA
MTMPSMTMPSMHHESMHPMHPMHPMHMMNMTNMTMPSMTMPSMHHESMHPMHPMHPMHMMNMTMPSTMMPHFPMWSNKNEVELRNMPVRPCNWNEYHSLTNPIKFDNFGNRCFAIGFDMHSYKPEEIKVTIKGNKWIVIEATMEEKVDPKAAEMTKTPEWMTVSWLSNAKGSVKRTYTREVAIPEECKPENMKCFMTGHGWLCFECPMTTSTTCPSTMPSHPMSHPFMSKMGHMMMPHHDMHHFSTRHNEVTFPVTVTVKA